MLKVQFTGTSPAATVVGQQQLSSFSNYFTGSNSAAWQTNVAQYAQVDYHLNYPGIDALYYGTSQRQLEYDLVVAPGADPSAIQMSIQGALGMQTDQQGNLLIQTAGGTVVQQAPVLYQLRQGSRAAVTGRYTLGSGGAVGFQPDTYDTTQPLYIDPVLNYSSYPRNGEKWGRFGEKWGRF